MKKISALLLISCLMQQSICQPQSLSNKESIRTSKKAIAICGIVFAAVTGTSGYMLWRYLANRNLIARGKEVAEHDFLDNIDHFYFENRGLCDTRFTYGSEEFDRFWQLNEGIPLKWFDNLYNDLVAYNAYLVSQDKTPWKIEKIYSKEPRNKGAFLGVAYTKTK